MLKNSNKKRWFYFILIIIIILSSLILYKKIGFHRLTDKIAWNKFGFSLFSRNKQIDWFLKELHVGDTLNTIAGIIIESQGEKFTIVNENNTWLILEKFNYPVSLLKVKEIIFGLADLKIIEQKTSKPENFAEINLEDLELNKNTTKISLLDVNHQKIVSLYLGKREFIASPNSNYQNYIFVRVPEELKTWLVAGSLPESFTFKDLVKQPLLHIPSENIVELKLIKVKDPKNLINIKKSFNKGNLNLLDVPKNYKLKDEYVLDNIINQFNYLNYEDVIKYSGNAAKVLDIQLNLGNQNNIEGEILAQLNLSDLNSKKNIVINLEVVYLQDKYYLKVKNNFIKEENHNNWMYKISNYAFQSLLTSKKDLIIEGNIS